MSDVKLFFLRVNPNAPTDGMLPLVSEQRREKLRRLHSEEDRTLGLYAAVLIRAALCKELDAENQALEFAVGSHGKPYLKNARRRFNISHTSSAVAAALADCDVGVDIERCQKIRPKVAERYFTAEERAYIAADPDRRFYEIWTKKEAFVKRSGRGLSEPLGSFCVLNGAEQGLKTYFCEDYVISVCAEDAKITFVGEEETAAMVEAFLRRFSHFKKN